MGAHRNVAMASEKNELFFTATLDERLLQIESVQTRHPHIHDHARRPMKGGTRQEISGRREQVDLIVGRA